MCHPALTDADARARRRRTNFVNSNFGSASMNALHTN